MAFLTVSDEAKIKLANTKYSNKFKTYSEVIIELCKFYKENHKPELKESTEWKL